MKNNDICEICGQGKISKQTETKDFSYRKQKISISNYNLFVCDVCEESIVCPSTIKETEKTLTDFRRQVDGLLTSAQIKAIRIRMGKTQIQMAEFIGVGKKNFARYENGQVTQNKTMDSLLRILNVDPNIFNKVAIFEKAAMRFENIRKPTDIKVTKRQDVYMQKEETYNQVWGAQELVA